MQRSGSHKLDTKMHVSHGDFMGPLHGCTPPASRWSVDHTHSRGSGRRAHDDDGDVDPSRGPPLDVQALVLVLLY
jgi:hypothetical protein